MKYLLTLVIAAGFLCVCRPVVGQLQHPEVPEHVQKEFERFVGRWELNGTLGDAEIEGTLLVRWSKNRRHLLVRVSLEDAGGTEEINQLIGWDPINEEIVSFHFALGGPVIGRSEIAAPGVWEGRTQLVYGDKQAKSTSRTVFEKDKITLKTKGEGLPDESYEIRKVPRKRTADKRPRKSTGQ